MIKGVGAGMGIKILAWFKCYKKEIDRINPSRLILVLESLWHLSNCRLTLQIKDFTHCMLQIGLNTFSSQEGGAGKIHNSFNRKNQFEVRGEGEYFFS